MDKKPSGAQCRKRRKQIEIEEAIASGDAKKIIKKFRSIGSVPVDDPTTALSWVRKAQLLSLELVLNDPSFTLREKFRMVKEMGDSIGRTRNSTALESEIKSLSLAVKNVQTETGAVRIETGHGFPRPATARGQRGRRGPRAIPGPSDSSTPSEDE